MIELKSVYRFIFLGCTITLDAKVDKEVDNRLEKISNAFGRQYERVWCNWHLKNNSKIRVIVLATLLCSSELWVTYRHRLRLLDRFNNRCLCNILSFCWSNFVTYIEVLEPGKDQHCSHATDIPLTQGRTCLKIEQSPPAQDDTVR